VKKDLVIGIDNDMRGYFFGSKASTSWKGLELQNEYKNFTLINCDIRDYNGIEKVFIDYGQDIKAIIHTAAQPSHDWAAKEPITDFTINANGTLNLLELTRIYSPKAAFIYTSTNKVYGDTPNNLPLIELEDRWELTETHKFYKNGIDESMNIDASLHSLFGVSKLSGDLMVQEYGRYFGMFTVCFRGGCLTGPNHSGAELHGFLAYLMKCAVTKTEYRIFGYKGKQVRDNIHSFDLVNAFYHFILNPKKAVVYNIGGSRFSNCSMKEAIQKCEEISGNKMKVQYLDDNRVGDHIWWISDISKFKNDYPNWELTYNIDDILTEINMSLNRRV
jgi:CDP-paratose 2-epimerase